MQTYTKKRAQTKQNEAVQVTDGNLAEVAAVVGGTVVDGHVAGITGSTSGQVDLEAFPGQWVLRREDGFFFVREDEWFRANYDVERHSFSTAT